MFGSGLGWSDVICELKGLRRFKTIGFMLTMALETSLDIKLCISMNFDEFDVWCWSLTRSARGSYIHGYEADAKARDGIDIADVSKLALRD